MSGSSGSKSSTKRISAFSISIKISMIKLQPPYCSNNTINRL